MNGSDGTRTRDLRRDRPAVLQHVMPTRLTNRRAAYAERWWLHAEPRAGMREALSGLTRFLATPTVSKHRIFAWLDGATLPDHQLIVLAREDDYFFGIVHSSVHELWARGMGTQPRRRTLTDLYNDRPTRLQQAHEQLDRLFTMPTAGPTRLQRTTSLIALRLCVQREQWSIESPGTTRAQRVGRAR